MSISVCSPCFATLCKVFYDRQLNFVQIRTDFIIGDFGLFEPERRHGLRSASPPRPWRCQPGRNSPVVRKNSPVVRKKNPVVQNMVWMFFFVSFVLVLSESASIFTATTHLFIFSIGKIKLEIIVKIMVMIVMFVSICQLNSELASPLPLPLWLLHWRHLCQEPPVGNHNA